MKVLKERIGKLEENNTPWPATAALIDRIDALEVVYKGDDAGITQQTHGTEGNPLVAQPAPALVLADGPGDVDALRDTTLHQSEMTELTPTHVRALSRATIADLREVATWLRNVDAWDAWDRSDMPTALRALLGGDDE